jgi:hypothetical protein
MEIERLAPSSAPVGGARTQAPDTSPGVEARQIEAWRRMEPWQKLRLVEELVRAGEELAHAGIRRRHPYAGEREIELRLAALRLDRETMTSRFGWDPRREGY